MSSLKTRLLVSALVVLSAFVVLTAIILEHAMLERAQAAEKDKLQGIIYGLIGSSTVSADKEAQVTLSALPDPLLTQPDSGRYAMVFDANNRELWRSPSLIQTPVLNTSSNMGEWVFSTPDTFSLGHFFTLSFNIKWFIDDKKSITLKYIVANDSQPHQKQLAKFRTTLWSWLAIPAILLMVIQLLLIGWGLRPMKTIIHQLQRIESGDADSISGDYPKEIQPLRTAINGLLLHEQRQINRYRNALSNLAHSLKTPLAAIRALTESKAETQTPQLTEQIDRLDQIITYQLKRAATAGTQALSKPILVRPLVEKISRALEKVYRDQEPSFDIQLDDAFSLRMDESDLMEVLGNIMDNACKYGKGCCTISTNGKNQIIIEDNGLGFPDNSFEKLLERGFRADTQSDGQGIGLSVCLEILKAYGATLKIGTSALGGAKLILTF